METATLPNSVDSILIQAVQRQAHVDAAHDMIASGQIPNSDLTVEDFTDAQLAEIQNRTKPARIKVDFSVENHGSIFLLRPHTQSANMWVSEHIPDDAQFFGNAIAIEPRYISDIVAGIQNDGLAVSA
jgi:hypothetical protein